MRKISCDQDRTQAFMTYTVISRNDETFTEADAQRIDRTGKRVLGDDWGTVWLEASNVVAFCVRKGTAERQPTALRDFRGWVKVDDVTS